MPQVRLKRLIKMAVRGKEGVEKSRLPAARMRKGGKSIRQIARTLCKPYSTVRDWLARMHRRGSKGRFDKKRRGGKRLLSNGDLKRLRRLLYEDPREHGFESKPWQADMILELIERKFGTVCSLRTLRRVLRKIHFSYRKSRPAPHNSASEEEQERFKTDTDVLLEGLRKEEFTIPAEDEGKMQTLPENGYGWRPTNGDDTVPTDFSKESVRMFCAVGDGRLHPHQHDLRPLGLALNLPFSPRSRIRTSQSRAVKYATPRSPAIPRMLRPLFLSRHAKSLSFARGFFSLPAILPSLSSLVPGMNLLPDSGLGLLPPSPSPLRGATQWHCRALIHSVRMRLAWPETVDQG